MVRTQVNQRPGSERGGSWPGWLIGHKASRKEGRHQPRRETWRLGDLHAPCAGPGDGGASTGEPSTM
jgi:hypothetical protein